MSTCIANLLECITTECEGASRREKYERVVLLATSSAAGAVVAVSFVASLVNTQAWMFVAAHIVVGVPLWLTCLAIIRGMLVSDRMKLAVSISSFIGLLLADTHMRALGILGWPLLVGVVDVMVVLRIDVFWCGAVVVGTVVWVVANVFEATYRFGLYDLPGSASTAEREAMWVHTDSCDTLPCTIVGARAVVEGAIVIVIVVANYAVCSGLSAKLELAEDQLDHTMKVLDTAALYMKTVDANGLSECVDASSGGLPADARTAFRTMEKHLRYFRPCLPQACLYERDDDNQSVSCFSAGSRTSYDAWGPPPTTRKVSFELRPCAATLLVVNLKGTLAMLSEGQGKFAQSFSTVLSSALAAVGGRRGVVDVTLGDHIFCSFNATFACALHVSSGVAAATHVVSMPKAKGIEVNTGVSSGIVSRGDMGCAGMRRYGVIGRPVSEAYGLERAGRELGIDALCSQECFGNQYCMNLVRLVPRMVTIRPSVTPELVCEPVFAEVEMSGSPRIPRSTHDDDWLYEKDCVPEWEEWNNAVRSFLDEDVSIDDAVAAAGTLGPDLRHSLLLFGSRTPLVVLGVNDA